MYRGPFSDKRPDETYDLRLMLQHSPNSVYDLRDCIDFETKLNFRSYVLRWYADKGMKSKVLELGKECPGELSRLVQADRSFQDLTWITSIRSGSFRDARDCLLNHSSSDLWEKDISLSMAKLANKLAVSTSGPGDNRAAEIDNGLVLVSAQRTLQGSDTESGHRVMSADELITLATSKINAGNDFEAVTHFGELVHFASFLLSRHC
jgi:hypothetical protein